MTTDNTITPGMLRMPMEPQQALTRPAAGDLCREHWVVPVLGLASGDAGGVVRAIARRDGTVMLHLASGGSRVVVRLDVCRAAQLSTGIWEAAGVSQRLIGCLGDDQPLSSVAAGSVLQSLTVGSCDSRVSRRRPATMASDVVDGADARRAAGGRLRRTRRARGKSLQVVAGLTRMGKSTLSRIERELSISEIVALAGALQIDPLTLIILPSSQHGSG